jgi:uncharacterized damage-inducible protein DinB
MKQYILDLFRYTDYANKKLLEVIKQLPDNSEAVKLFSHLITAQNKWLNRITRETDDSKLTWSGPVFPIEDLEEKWNESVERWLELIEEESDLDKNIIFSRPADGKKMQVRLIDIALQLNYHAIHHRAQINTLISKQGLVPPPTDYILTVLKEV